MRNRKKRPSQTQMDASRHDNDRGILSPAQNHVNLPSPTARESVSSRKAGLLTDDARVAAVNRLPSQRRAPMAVACLNVKTQ